MWLTDFAPWPLSGLSTRGQRLHHESCIYDCISATHTAFARHVHHWLSRAKLLLYYDGTLDVRQYAGLLLDTYASDPSCLCYQSVGFADFTSLSCIFWLKTHFALLRHEGFKHVLPRSTSALHGSTPSGPISSLHLCACASSPQPANVNKPFEMLAKAAQIKARQES